jgi:uncharacterized protein YjbJ (UPF0337 family)
VSSTDRFEDRVDQASGKTKKMAGKATGDERLEAEGTTQHKVAKTKGNLREAGGKVKDAAADTARKVKRAFRR